MTLFTSRLGYQAPEGVQIISRRPWEAGFWRRAPISGLLALITAVLCGIAAIAVLETSDGRPVNQWRVAGYNVQPTVLLSVFATLANALFRYAFTEGVRVSWWVRAQRGTSIGALHRSWDHAQSALPIVTAGRHISLTAVASFCVLLLLIDGPFFQRASTLDEAMRYISTNLTIPVAPTPFMMGATGIYADHDFESTPTLFNPLFSRVLQQYTARQPITLQEFGCKGKCEFDIVAPGWDIDCKSWDSPYRLMSQSDWNQFLGDEDYDGPPTSQTMFWSNVTYHYDSSDLWYDLYRYRTRSLPSGLSYNGYHAVPYAFPYNTLLLSSMRKSTLGGEGTLTWRYCVLREAVQKYPVTVTSTTISIHPMDLHQNNTVYTVIRSPEIGSTGNWPSTLGGLWLSLRQAFAGEALLDFNGAGSTVRTNGSSPLVYVEVPDAVTLTTYDVTWSDPIDDMISMIQELSLRIAIETTSHVPPSTADQSQAEQAARLTEDQSYIYSPNLTSVNRPLSQSARVSMIYPETVYQSNRAWMAGALAAIGIAFCAILPIFGSWWQLGRTVSLSPIEIARAFDAPLLQQADPNGTGPDIVHELGATKIQYGASTPLFHEGQFFPTEATKLSSSVEVLEDGTNVISKRRLHFGLEDTIGAPHHGETFDGAGFHWPSGQLRSSQDNLS